MTKAGAVAEQAIAAIDTAARRTRDASRVGGSGADGPQEHGAFSDVLTRMAEGDFSLRGSLRRSVPAEGGGSGTRASQRAQGRHIAGDSQELEPRQASATKDGAASEPQAVGENVPPDRNNRIEELLQAVVRVLAPGEVQAGQSAQEMPGGRSGVGPARQPEVPSARTRPLEGGGTAVANTEAEVRVSVIARETHYAPIALASLSDTAAERAAMPANLGTGPSAQTAAGRADRSVSGAYLPSSEARQASGAADVTTRARSGAAGEGPDDGLQHMRPATREAKVEAVEGSDTEHAGRKASLAAATGETRVSGGQSPQSAPATVAVSVVQQVADRITAMFSDPGGDAPDPAAKGATATTPSAGSQLKVLRIELQPAELGTIEVHLSLKEDALELKLEASRAETATIIARDKDALANMLRSAGYLIDGLTVQVVESDRSLNAGSQPGGHAMQTSSQSTAHAQSGSSQPDGRSDRTDRQPHNNGQGSHSYQRDEHASDQRSRRPADGALYV
ncbi:MAG TPA: flagellar hook-length control protein FliK [Hyphomicrobiaceae bacterium]|nr:flagellar hook-length control protein FliK [Hyphomicrobiaceae bacterium]